MASTEARYLCIVARTKETAIYGIACPPELPLSSTSSAHPLRVLDLFSGAGGMALGFEAAGCESIGAVELDDAAASTFGRNFPEAVVFGGPDRGDISRLRPADILDGLHHQPDIVVGGPPCQGFSRIGRAKRRSLEDKLQERHGWHTARNDHLSGPHNIALPTIHVHVCIELRPLPPGG